MKKLSEFLREERVITKFRINVVNCNLNFESIKLLALTDDFIDSKIETIIKAFYWYDSPEGEAYWRQLYLKHFKS